jgi:mercuric ion binding protein
MWGMGMQVLSTLFECGNGIGGCFIKLPILGIISYRRIKMKGLFLILLFSTLLVASKKDIMIDIKGMTCPLCTMVIKKNLKKQSGVLKVKVKLNTKRAYVMYDETQITIQKLLHAIEEVGYSGKVSK